ncbi:ABC transporter permease [Petroclostridium sp. X23]|uniref:ABC transporter permease n=1 Tax=Petroclostridium sp. X23 TaxID=3045146 RepID=UPI0024ACC016|nr:ABC transporter permease [Petroclostridium sp. X23]WHH58068.1 ABC transporter permease [Petroclostridium sp. X23]
MEPLLNQNTFLDWKECLKKISIYLAFLCIFIIFSIINPNFISISNILNIIVQSSILAIIAVGETMVILTNGIDLSVGSIVAFVGIAMGLALVAGVPVVLVVILGMVLGLIVGAINGIIISYGRVPSFIVTLGMMGIARGAALALNSGKPVAGFPSAFEKIASTKIVNIPIFIFYCAIIYVLMYIVLHKTKFGRYIYAIGGNRDAARLSGVKVKKVEMFVYALAGLFCGIGAIMLTTRLNYATPIAGNSYELDAVASVVIGGTALSGGQGKILGSLMGALILGTLRNGLTILNVPVYFQQIVIGIVIIMAVFIDKLKEKEN